MLRSALQMFVPSSCTTDTLYSILASVGPPRPPCIFGSVFTMAHWAVVRPRHTEWTRVCASYRTRTRGGDQWSSGGQNITTNSGQCGEIIMIRFICALSSVLWAPCPISPHYEGHYHAAPPPFVACQIEIIFIKCVSLPRTTISMWILWIGCVLDVNMVMCVRLLIVMAAALYDHDHS